MKIRLGAGLCVLAAVVGAAGASAQGSRVMICRIDIAPVHVYTDPIPFDPPTHQTQQRIREIWKSIALEKYGKGPDQMKRWDDLWCDDTSDYDAYVRSNLTGFRYKTFSRVPFPNEKINDGSAIVQDKSSPGSSRADTTPRAHIVIQDAKPTQATPAERAARILQEQREDAAKRAKAAAEIARNNAELQAKIKKFYEERKKQGAAQ